MNLRTQKAAAAAAASRTRRPRRTTISNAAEPMSELNRNVSRSVAKSPYSNLQNLSNIIEVRQQQIARFGGLSELGTIADTDHKQPHPVGLGILNFDDNAGRIHKSKSSPALLSQAVRELPVQSHVSASQNSLASLLKQLAQENIQKDILSTLPSPCFKLVNSPPSPKVLTVGAAAASEYVSSPKNSTGECSPSPKTFSVESTPPPSFFQAASPSSWKNYVDLQRRVRSPSECENLAPVSTMHRASSLGNNAKENATKAHNRIKSRSDINLAQMQYSDRNFPMQSPNSSSVVRSQLFANRDDNFYSSPTDISMELNRDLALDPIPPPLSMDSIDGCDTLQTGEFSHHRGATTDSCLQEIEFLFNLSETLLKLTSDSHITGQVSDCIPELKRKQPGVVPSSDALKLSRLLLTSEAMRISSHALKFSQSQQKKGILKLDGVLKTGIGFKIIYSMRKHFVYFVGREIPSKAVPSLDFASLD